MPLQKTTSSNNQKRGKSLLAGLFHADDSPPDTASDEKFDILKLPESVRLRIWTLLGFYYTKRLRLVCSVIKEDIDTASGISSAIDSTFDDFAFHCSIAIRKLAIHELIVPVYVPFLKYPLALRELEIRGEISSQNFNYIIKSCPNIAKLTITFNKFVLDQQTPMFPLSSALADQNVLSNLRSIKLVSSTKKLPELFYVYRNVVSLLRDVLEDAKLTSVHVWIAHKAPNLFFKEIMMTTLVLVHKSAPILRYLSLTFRDKDQHTVAQEGGGSKAETSSAPAPSTPQKPQPKRKESGLPEENETSKRKSDTNKDITLLRRATPLPGVIVTHHTKDVHSEPVSLGDDVKVLSEGEGEADEETTTTPANETNDGITEAVKYLDKNPWQKAVCLEQLSLTTPLMVMQYLVNIISARTKLQSLSLEAVGSGGQSWNLYKEYITKCDVRQLTTVSFVAVNHTDSKGVSSPIDLEILRNAKKLKKLTFLCQKKDDHSRLSRAQHVSVLSKTLNEISFERLLLTPCQIFRILFCSYDLLSISLAYWSISDNQFSTFMFLLKWAVKLDLTDVHKINLVDTKIRFRNKRRAVRNLQDTLKISVKYKDMEETKLIIDSKSIQDNTTLAPRISVFKITAPQPKPKRNKDNTDYDYKTNKVLPGKKHTDSLIDTVFSSSS